MEIKEYKLSEKELKKIKKKYWKSILVNAIMFLVFTILFYLSNKNRTNYDFSLILFNILFGIAVLLLFLNLIGTILSSKDLRKDSKERKKIKTAIIIKEKNELVKTGSSRSNISTTTYRLLFENNDFLTVYDVRKNDFNKVKVGDTITLVCAKYSKLVIKIEWNSISIKNKGYLA
ncbi:MAG: hypothetical protein ABJD66_10555 [Cellulophaga sp.]|uniref:hypothetical protein n=1 Tax=Cellulophaga sp. TaxID=1972202 RepID=UPI003264D915